MKSLMKSKLWQYCLSSLATYFCFNYVMHVEEKKLGNPMITAREIIGP